MLSNSEIDMLDAHERGRLGNHMANIDESENVSLLANEHF